jgi:outer membrane protein
MNSSAGRPVDECRHEEVLLLLKRAGRVGAFALLAAGFLSTVVPLRGQEGKPAAKTFTLDEAVSFALENEPRIRAALEDGSASSAGATLSRTSYLPRLDGLWQTNLATRNNIAGLLLPQAVIPSITGPVLPESDSQVVWGNAGGLLLSWEPFDFGARKASVDAAREAERRSTAETDLARLEVAVAAADGFLALAAAQEEVRAATADVERRQVFADSVRALVGSQLRPGADASRADAELAAARIQMVRAESAEESRRDLLSRALGIAGTPVVIKVQPLLDSAPEVAPVEAAPASHPLAVAGSASVEEKRATTRSVARSYAPRFVFQSAVFGRSSGAHPDGTTSDGPDSLTLDRSNWAVGVTMIFPLLDYPSLRARRNIQAANEQAAEARYDQIVQDLTTQTGQARARLDEALKVAEQTPTQLEATRNAERQTLARYQAGLGTVVEVADAERLLVQAEIEDSLARLSVWRGLLHVNAAEGDLQPFLKAVRAATAGGS